jgi:hypothetical protein
LLGIRFTRFNVNDAHNWYRPGIKSIESQHVYGVGSFFLGEYDDEIFGGLYAAATAYTGWKETNRIF